MKLLTVTIPCYNSEGYMEKCIESILPGGERVEIIIINDGSKDRTGEIADEYPLGSQLLSVPNLAVFLFLLPSSPGTASSGKPVRKPLTAWLSPSPFLSSLKRDWQHPAGPRPVNWWKTTWLCSP